MSLRLRLIVFPAVIVLAGLLTLASLELDAAQDRVKVETASGMALGRTVVRNAIAAHADDTDAEALAGVAADLPHVRHVRLVLAPAIAPLPRAVGTRRRVPVWFATLVAPERQVERFPVTAQGRGVGEVLMIAAPDDELHEIWSDWSSLALALAILSAVIIAVVVLSVTLALRPLAVLTEALDRLEQGDFDVALRPFRDKELRRLSEQFNSLVASLSRATADNRLLVDRLMSVQEAERKEIAHELHDEFGPSLFGIRADLSSISRLAKRGKPAFGEIEERVGSISELVGQIQKINSRMLERLRPMVLDQMGLSEALARLIEDWRERYPATAWDAKLTDVGEVGEAAGLAAYRAVRECLTNVVRHAEATAVEVRLEREDGWLRVVIADDGRGFGKSPRFGFGLLGMSERARALGGRLDVSRKKGGGGMVEILLPTEAA